MIAAYTHAHPELFWPVMLPLCAGMAALVMWFARGRADYETRRAVLVAVLFVMAALPVLDWLAGGAQ